MQDTLHFLKDEMQKMRQDMKKIMTQREEDKQNMKKIQIEMKKSMGDRREEK